MTDKPVFAASEREKVLFPDPAMPVTRTRRPIAKAASLIDVSIPQVPCLVWAQQGSACVWPAIARWLGALAAQSGGVVLLTVCKRQPAILGGRYRNSVHCGSPNGQLSATSCRSVPPIAERGRVVQVPSDTGKALVRRPDGAPEGVVC